MENLVSIQRSVAVRGASGKLGSIVKESLELALLDTVSITRETNFSLIKNSMIILDFTGPNPKNEKYWQSFSLSKALDQYFEFLEWVKGTHSVYIRIGSYGEFSSNLTHYEYVAKEISHAVNAFLAQLNINGCILYASNIYGRRSLRNFVEVAIESYSRRETLTLLNKDKVIRPIHFDDFVRFLVDLTGRLQSNPVTYSNFALISESLYSVSTINEYVRNQVANFDIRRELSQKRDAEFPLIDLNSNTVKFETMPNRLKSYIDFEIKSGLECDSDALKI